MRPTNRPIATKALELAIANIGVTEVGVNRGAAVEAYQASCKPPIPAGSPWCAAVVRFRMKQAATALGTTYDPTFPRSGYTPDWANWAKENGCWISVVDAKDSVANKTGRVLPGDLVLFYIKPLGRIGHIGVIQSVHSWGCWTIEGNTSPEPSDAYAVERDGDGYFRKKRNWSELGTFGGVLTVNF